MARKYSASARLAKAFTLVVPETALAVVAVEDETTASFTDGAISQQPPSARSGKRVATSRS
jgi:hypothetical protein